MDPLQDRLFHARAGGAAFAQSVVRPPWGLRLEGDMQLAVHAMVAGDAWLWLDDPTRAVELRAGDLALVRGDLAHCLASRPGEPCEDLARFARTASLSPDGGDTGAGEPHTFLCGAYRFAGDVGQALLDALPDVLHVRPRPGHRLRRTTELLSQELAEPEQGQQTVLDRLLDVMLVQLIRHHFDVSTGQAPAWYAANAHPSLGLALRAMHQNPGRGWTVSELAEIASVSRATFARTFREVLGQTPMEYLTDWRMTLARDDLRGSNASLGQIANRYGYSTPYAFSAAFVRHHGIAPGRFRRTSDLDAAISGEPTGPSARGADPVAPGRASPP